MLAYGDTATHPRLQMEDSTVNFTSRWLLHQLIIKLGPFLVHKCIHPKIGTLIYRRGVDLTTCLSWALSQRKDISNTLSKDRLTRINNTYNEAQLLGECF